LGRATFGKKSIGACLQGFNMVPLFRASSQNQDWNQLERNVSLDTSASFQPGFLPKILIQNHEVGRHLETKLDGFRDGHRKANRMPCALEQPCADDRLCATVFNQEDVGHGIFDF
jgi:hypothetical protein